MREQLDITAPEGVVVVEYRKDPQGYVLYIHVEGITVLRICRISNLQVIDSNQAPRSILTDLIDLTDPKEGGVDPQ